VTHHDLHHAQAGWNYGLYFTWWDRMMGAEHPQYEQRFAAAVRRPRAAIAAGEVVETA
jgi:sterol desaturase/sphingolipid hydroxylase (fatty acid hydroxylase superfamily)